MIGSKSRGITVVCSDENFYYIDNWHSIKIFKETQNFKFLVFDYLALKNSNLNW